MFFLMLARVIARCGLLYLRLNGAGHGILPCSFPGWGIYVNWTSILDSNYERICAQENSLFLVDIDFIFQSWHVALMGDHKQLQTVIVSWEAQVLGLGMSLFERSTEEIVADIIVSHGWCWYSSGVPSNDVGCSVSHASSNLLLPTAQVLHLSSAGRTIDMFGSTIPQLLAPDPYYFWSHAKPGASLWIVFQDHASDESMKDQSQFSQNEAYIVASVVEDLLINNLIDNPVSYLSQKNWCCYVKYLASPREWCCIAACYVAQISLLTQFLKTDATYQACLNQWSPCNVTSHIEVKMVGSFEGCKKEVIIFSTVWNNTGGYISLLANKQHLIVVQKRIWLSWPASIQVKQDEWGWERGCCYQGGQVCWVMEVSHSFFDRPWVGVHCWQDTLQRALISSFWIGEILFILVHHLMINIFYLSI